LSFEARATNYNQILDGYLIPGGRDIDPILYGAENQGSVVSDPESSKKRFEHAKDFLLNLNPDIPIFGVCYGY